MRNALIVLLLFPLLWTNALLAQEAELSIAARGTGRTTGHIAELTVTNNGDQPVHIEPGWFFIPSTNRYQSYVGSIPRGITILPGQTVTIPVDGYCANVHTPPVPYGVSMTEFKDWVLIDENPPTGIPITSEPTVPEPMNPPGGSTSMETRLVPDRVVPPFHSGTIPGIINSPGYQPTPGGREQPNGSITLTYPDTDIPVAGTIDFDSDPEHYASLVVAIAVQIVEAASVVQQNPNITTPFSSAPEREREALIQQTFWIVTAALTGDDYTLEDFTENTYRQFTQASGTPVSALEEEDKAQLDGGVADFWNAFSAVGLEAKVIRGHDQEPGVPQPDFFQQETTGSGVEESNTAAKCQCENVSFSYSQLVYTDDGPDGTVGTPGFKFPAVKSYPIDGKETTITVPTHKSRNRFSFTIEDIKMTCSCSTGGACPTTAGPYLDMGESKGANAADQAASAVKEAAEKAAEQAAETIDKAKETVEKATEKAEGADGDQPSGSDNQNPQVDDVNTESVELTSKDGKHTIFVKLPKGREKTIQFTISGTCSSGDCSASSCKKTFLIKIERSDD